MRDTKFAQEFLRARKARGLTQRACASMLDVSTVTVWNWEQGRSAPWSKDQAKILLIIGEDAPKATFPHGGEYKHRVAHSGPVPTFPKPVAIGEEGNGRDNSARIHGDDTRRCGPGIHSVGDAVRLAPGRRRLIDNFGDIGL